MSELEARVVDGTDDPRQPGEPLAQPDDDVAGAAVERLAEGGERGDEPLPVGVVDGDGVDARQADLGLQLVRRPLGDDVPVVDDPDPVREHVGLLEVLRRQEDR